MTYVHVHVTEKVHEIKALSPRNVMDIKMDVDIKPYPPYFTFSMY